VAGSTSSLPTWSGSNTPMITSTSGSIATYTAGTQPAQLENCARPKRLIYDASSHTFGCLSR
jgi:hypothetical protein